MERRQMSAGRLVRIAAVVTAVAMVGTGVTLAVLPRGAGSHPAAPGILAPGSQGSARSHPWWNPWGWFGGGGPSAAHGRTIAAAGGPQVGRRLPQALAPAPRRVREIVSRRTANTRVYRLADGRAQADISAGPVNYWDRGRRWQPINTTVRQVAKPGYVVGNTTNTFRSYFGSSAARLERLVAPGGGTLSVALDGAHVGAPRAARNTVTYTRVANDTSLRYQVTPSALKESITLASPSAPASFSYTIRVGGGLVPWQRPNGQVVFSRNSAGTPPVLVLPAPYMTSARSDRWSPYGKVWSPRVAQRIAWNPAAHLLRLTLRPDAAWLRQPGRVFPVVIDPTIAIVPDASSAQNVMIDQDTPSVNYAGDYRLEAGTTSTGSVRSLLSFPLDSIPSGASIDSADLRLYRDQNFGTGSSSETVQVDQATSAWNATTATWSNASSNDGQEGKNEVIVDDSDFCCTSTTGSWTTTNYSPAYDGEYQWSATSGKTFAWYPTLTEPGRYWVAAHYAAPAFNSAASYTVNYNGGSSVYTVDQTSGSGGVWTTLAQKPFVAGTSGSVALKAGSILTEADAVRFRLWAAANVSPNAANVWDSFPVRNIVQSWVDGSSPNDGFVLKSSSEGTPGLGGPIYQGAEPAYGGETATYPQLVVTYAAPGVVVNPITTIDSTGAHLSWSPYVDPTPGGNSNDDLANYKVYRSTTPNFTPSPSTLIAWVSPAKTSYTDTSAVPTPPGSSQLNTYYYMVAVRTLDHSTVPGSTERVQVPTAGSTEQIIDASGDTTLSKAQPNTAEQHLSGQPWLAAGNNDPTYGTTRTVTSFPSMSSAGIPSDAVVTDAELRLWGFSNHNTGTAPASYAARPLTQDFDPAAATWNNAAAGTPWTTAGGASGPATGTVSGLTNNPGWVQWPVTSAVQGWINDSTSEHGLLVKVSNEASATALEQELFLDSSASEPALQPQLAVTYTEPTPEDTYYAPDLPDYIASASSFTTPVTITNTTGTTLNPGDWVLSYHWLQPDGTDVSNSSDQVQTVLPASLAPGATVTVQAQVTAPDISGLGNEVAGYQLGWDLYDKTTGTWLSGTNPGIPTIAPLDQPASVAQTGSGQLGLEKYFQYTGVNTGSGSALLNNAANGNVVWSYNPFSNPSRGFDTFVRISYNSMDTSDSAMGFGWSLQASTLMRLGTPLDFHPNPNPRTITLTDGDGTSHVFSWDSTANQWVSPPGLHYYLQPGPDNGLCGANDKGQGARAWLLTRPDRTQFYFDCQGYQSAVIDRNGNEADFAYTSKTSNNEPVKFLDNITDPSGRQTLTLSYYQKGDDDYSYIDATGNVVHVVPSDNNPLTNPKIIGQVKSITDISGRTVTFVYTTQGLMAQMTDGDGSSTPKVFKFGYDMTQGNKNVKLVSVTDPRTDPGNHTTQIAYYTAPQDPKFKWSTKTITDRLGGTTGFAYTEPAPGQPTGSVQTQVTDQNGNSSTYALDLTGRPVQVTNAKQQVTTLAWDSDNNVTSLTEDNGATTTWTYDPNTGYPLTMTDAQANHDGTAGTTYTYQTGLNGHIADLTSLLTPQQRLWTFGYNANGNLTSVTDPDGNAPGAAPGSYTTKYTYNSTGTLHTATDANGNPTTYSNYDVTGYPQTITDALGNATNYTYDSRGNVTLVSDPFNDTTSYSYDVFGRLGQIVTSKNHSASPPVYITTPAPVYDGNDNVVTSFTATNAETDYTYNGNDELTVKQAPPDSSGTDQPETTYGYDPAGNLTSVTDPNGNAPGATPGSYTTTFGYDAINELTSVTDAAGDQTSYGYDDVGNRTSVTDPLGNLTQQAYNLNHWPTVATDAGGFTTKKSYDLDGLVAGTTDQNNHTTQYTLDPRGDVVQVMAPHDTSGATTIYNTSQYVYDQAGNRTQVLTPRAVANGISRSSQCVTTQTCPFTYVTQYDADNHVTAQQSAYDPSDTNPNYQTPATTTYQYNAAGRLKTVTAPPSGIPAQGGPNVTTYTYFDNNWVKTSTDPWGIATKYDYNNDGQQASRTITSDDTATSRTMTSTYYPGDQLATLDDHGVPTGLASEAVDNSDSQNTSFSGSWTKSSSVQGYQGYDYAVDGPGSAGDTFTWKLNIPADGSYSVYVKYPATSDAATDAAYKVSYHNGSATVKVNQTTNTGQNGWFKLGEYAFTQSDTGQKVTLTQNTNAKVVADAVRVVSDTTGVSDTSHHDFVYTYDATGNLQGIADSSPTATVANYAMAYDQVNRLTQVKETDSAGNTVHTTSYGYDADSNLATRGHDSASSTYTYNPRNLLIKQIDVPSSGPSQTTTFTYGALGLRSTEGKPNNNNVTYSYFADGLLKHQLEKNSSAATVAEHTYTYTPDGMKASDAETLMNADTGALMTHNLTYTYDPRDRITGVFTDGTQTEAYVHDATDNVTSQTINTKRTDFSYDRDRLLSATSGGSTVNYNYDPLGRLDTVTGSSSPCSVLERNTYDGFDNIISHQQVNTAGTGCDTTSYTYDPLNRQTSQQVNGGTTTQYSYLGLSSQLVSETGGSAPKTYTYTPDGERLSQTNTSNGTTSYYSYNDHSDVEALTNTNGTTTATYGYTAYGQPIPSQWTGADKNNTSPDPTKTPFNSYRFNAMRWDSSSGQYDMGFRNYSANLNAFLSRDMYNGALGDMQLVTDPFTGNRYTFGAGNPISNIELDGHTECDAGYCPTQRQTNQVNARINEGYNPFLPVVVHFGTGISTVAIGANEAVYERGLANALRSFQRRFGYIPNDLNSCNASHGGGLPTCGGKDMLDVEYFLHDDLCKQRGVACAGPAASESPFESVLSAAAASGMMFGGLPGEQQSAAKLQPYGGPGGGHHVPAKSAFIGDPAYDPLRALAIPNDELDRLGMSHSAITGAQMSAYRAYAATGKTLTWSDVSTIETNALIRGGMSSDMAQGTVDQAIAALKSAGVSGPTRIPWGG